MTQAMEIDPEAMSQLLNAALTAGATALTLALTLLGRWLNERFKSDAARAIILRADGAAQVAVAAVEQTVRKRLSEARPAGDDGVLTHEEAQAIMKAALEVARTELGRQGMEQLARVVEDTDAVLRNRIEAAVAGAKK